jgi:hypothetical protein
MGSVDPGSNILAEVLRSWSKTERSALAMPELSTTTPYPRLPYPSDDRYGKDEMDQFSVVTTTLSPSMTQYFS